jgi:lincosamide and streptogramin A transport system ATP-binding/permease protein
MSLIRITNLTFAYEGSFDNVFTDVSFQLDTDWKLGFCGRNGRGKTTFLKLLMGEYEYSGSILASTSFEYFPYTVSNCGQNALELLEQIVPETLPWQRQRELSLLELNEDAFCRPFETLSNGEQTKVLLAGLFLRENRFLLIDEPTNHLDLEAREAVARYLCGKKGFILVSHDRAFLDHCTDHTLSINKANIEVINGNFSVWFAQKERQDLFEEAKNEKLEREIKRLKESARQSSEWADKVESTKKGSGAEKLRQKGSINIDSRAYIAEKSRRMQQRRKNLERRQQTDIAEKSKLLKNIDKAEVLKFNPLSYFTDTLLTVSNFRLQYGDRERFKEVSFTVERGERVLLHGGNGTGKSSVLKAICGENIPHSGTIQLGSRLVVSIVAQDASSLSGVLADYAKSQGIDETLFLTILRKLDFARTQFTKNMSELSAGQKKKVLLARSLCQSAHLYIWDEPLNYIDVLSRIQIERLIAEYKPTMLFIEHDSVFCERIATKVIKMKRKDDVER